jgi:hypothetical protein
MTGTLICLVYYTSSYYSTQKDYISGYGITETGYQYQATGRLLQGQQLKNTGRILEKQVWPELA